MQTWHFTSQEFCLLQRFSDMWKLRYETSHHAWHIFTPFRFYCYTRLLHHLMIFEGAFTREQWFHFCSDYVEQSAINLQMYNKFCAKFTATIQTRTYCFGEKVVKNTQVILLHCAFQSHIHKERDDWNIPKVKKSSVLLL